MNYRSLLIACLATLGLAVAGWGQADGKIAFISGRDGYEDVWIMNADGSAPVNLTKGRDRDCASPAWSPDGTKMAYIGDVSYNDQYGGEVWLMDADGGNPRQLTNDSDNKMLVSWSEDGRSIYYTRAYRSIEELDTDEWDGPDMFIMALDGGDSSPVDWREVPRYRYFGRSPDGTKEAVVVLREKGDEENLARLYISDVREDEASVFRWPSYGTDPAVFLRSISGIGVIPLLDLDQSGLCVRDSTAPFATVSSGQDNVVCVSDDTLVSNPTWSPDSMRIAFDHFTDLIWAVDLDGGNLVELTNGLGGYSPAWQPVVPAATATSVEAHSWGRIKALLSADTR